MTSTNRLEVLEKVIEYDDLGVYHPTEWEEEFIGSMKEKFERYGKMGISISDKQYASLERILKKQEESL